MDTVLWTAVAAGAGLLLGPILTTWAERVAPSNLETAVGWWRGGGASARVITVVSISTGALLAMVTVWHGGTAALAAWWWLVVTGVVLATIDIRHRRLPRRETAAMAIGGVLALGGAAAVEGRWDQFAWAILSGLVVLAVAAAVQLTFPGHTGGGDTSLYGALALYLGWFGLPGLLRGLLLATFLTALLAVIVWTRRRTGSATFPAGPTLIVGAIIVIIYSNGHPG